MNEKYKIITKNENYIFINKYISKIYSIKDTL